MKNEKKGKIFKILTVFMFAAVFAVNGTLLSACNKKTVGEQIDKKRTQIYVSNYNGGEGFKWLEDLKYRFEDLKKEISYENDKKGVQIIISNGKETHDINGIYGNIKSSDNELYFTSGDRLVEFIAEGLILEITDMVKEKLTEYGEAKSIEDKMPASLKQHHNRNGKYYALPLSDSALGIIYDVDLFEERKLYFKDGGGFITSLNDKKAAGPDGKYDTYDDGLPATHNDFFVLCDRMVKIYGIDPIAWTGEHSAVYSTFLLKAIWADYHGIDEGALQYNAGSIAGKNTTTVITGFDTQDKPIIEPITISRDNYIELAKQPGRYYGFSFWDGIVNGKYYNRNSIDISQSHLMAQADYLESKFLGTPTAMLIEGTWWENEAKDSGAYQDMVDSYGEEASPESRRFAIMPLPKATADKIGSQITNYSELGSAFINAKTKAFKVPLIKEFLQFALTDESMRNFTKQTNIFRSYDYDLSEEDIESLTYFAQSYNNLRKDSQTLYLTSYSHDIEINVVTPYKRSFYLSDAIIDNKLENVFLNAMLFRGVRAKEYFEGTYTRLTKI